MMSEPGLNVKVDWMGLQDREIWILFSSSAAGCICVYNTITERGEWGPGKRMVEVQRAALVMVKGVLDLEGMH